MRNRKVLPYAMASTLLCGCTLESSPPLVTVRPTPVPILVPAPPDSIQRVNDKLLETGEQLIHTGEEVLEQGKEALLPDKPEQPKEQPRPNIHSDPRNIANLSTATLPRTYTFEAVITNAEQAYPVVRYDWVIEKTNLPLVNDNEEILRQEDSASVMRFTFTEKTTYRVTVTVFTAEGGQSSSSVSIWGRE